MGVRAFVMCYSFNGRITVYAETKKQAEDIFADLDTYDLFENADKFKLTDIILCPDSSLNRISDDTASDTMKHCNCSHFDMNDVSNGFGTCEILDKDFHCTGECVCPPDEKRLVEGLQAERDANMRLLNPKYANVV